MKRRTAPLVAALAAALSTLPTVADAAPTAKVDVATVVTSGNVGSESAVVMSDDDLPIIAVFDASDDTIGVISCADPLCDTGERFDIASGIGYGDVDIALAPNGTPVIAYTYTVNSGAHGGVRVVTCGNPTCSNQVTTSELAWNQWGGFSSAAVVVRSDGTPVVGYTGIDGWVMSYRVVTCDDPACTGTGDISTLIDFSYGGVAGDLTLDGGDRIAVVVGRYVDSSARLVRCENPNCASSSSTVLDGKFRTPKIAARDDDLAIVGVDTDGRVNMIRCEAQCDDAVRISATGHAGRSPDVSFVGAGHAAAVYYDSSHRLWFVDCPQTCASPQYVTRDAGPSSLGLSIDGGGSEAYVSYFQRSRANLGIVHVTLSTKGR